MIVNSATPNSLSGYVARYTNEKDRLEKVNYMIDIINYLEPFSFESGRKFEGIVPTPEMRALTLDGRKLTAHPVFEACDILARISGWNNKAEEDRKTHTKDFLRVTAQIATFSTAIQDPVSLYLRFRFYSRLFQDQESMDCLASALSKHMYCKRLTDAVIREVRWAQAEKIKLPFNELYANSLGMRCTQDPANIELHKLRVNYVLNRSETIRSDTYFFSRLKESIDALVQAEPTEGTWRDYAIRVTYGLYSAYPFHISALYLKTRSFEEMDQHLLFLLKKDLKDEIAQKHLKNLLEKVGSVVPMLSAWKYLQEHKS